ncbi:hypothetical protein [Streptomyces sp. NPDC006132]|uniref:hypothetical protein n=1 Tax=Streptomyces sp. NPDC006132 TaxID=3156732 RepID=UPI0033CE5BAB
MGAELNRLARHGWRSLHSIPLANKVAVDHLLIGPAGCSASTQSTTTNGPYGSATIP